MKVVVTDYNFENLAIEEDIFSSVGVKLEAYQCTTENEVLKVSKDADGILNQYAPVGKKVINSLEKCKVIGRYGIGVDTINVEAATKRGIVVINVPSFCVEEVSNHTLALIMNATRKILPYSIAIKEGKWDWKIGRPIHRLKGQILGLIGCGKIGHKLAEKVGMLGLNVISYDPYISSEEMKKWGIEKVDLEKLLRESDIVSIHAPLTEETHYLISASELKKMKQTAILINVARGAIVDEKALYEALVDEQISEACLDVVENEPSQGKIDQISLFKLENVYLTPHVAWYSEESIVELRKKAAQDVGRVLHKKTPRGFVNPEIKEKLSLKE